MTDEQADLLIAFDKTVRLLSAILGLAEQLLADAELGRQPHGADVTREALKRTRQELSNTETLLRSMVADPEGREALLRRYHEHGYDWPKKSEESISVTQYERADLIGAVAQTTEMLTQLLTLFDEVLTAAEFGRVPTAAEMARMREHAETWRGQIASLRQRIGAAAIEPRRVQ